MIRRIVGIAHVADLEKIEDGDARSECERKALRCGRTLILDAATLTPETIVETITGFDTN